MVSTRLHSLEPGKAIIVDLSLLCLLLAAVGCLEGVEESLPILTQTVAECPCPALGPGGQLSGNSRTSKLNRAPVLLHTVVSGHNAQPCFPANPFSQIPLAMGFPPQPHSQSQKCSSLTCFGQDNPKASLASSLVISTFFLSLSFFFSLPCKYAYI